MQLTPHLIGPNNEEYRLLFARAPVTVLGILMWPGTQVAVISIAIAVAATVGAARTLSLLADHAPPEGESRRSRPARSRLASAQPFTAASDEVGTLARDFDAMAERIQALVTDKGDAAARRLARAALAARANSHGARARAAARRSPGATGSRPHRARGGEARRADRPGHDADALANGHGAASRGGAPRPAGRRSRRRRAFRASGEPRRVSRPAARSKCAAMPTGSRARSRTSSATR